MWKLIIEDDEGKRTVIHLTRDEYTFGRLEGHAIRLTERNISRKHARLAKAANGFDVEDLSSYNGVYVNGTRVEQLKSLAHGDLVQIGDYRIVLQNEQAEESSNKRTMPTLETTMSTITAGTAGRGRELLERPSRLVMLVGPTPGTEYSIESPKAIIGRAEDAAIVVDHNSVSRVHAEVVRIDETRWEIVDRGSSNGLRVNRVDLSQRILEPGDVVELGDVQFRFVARGQVFIPAPGELRRVAPGDVTSASRASSGGAVLAPKRKSTLLYALMGAAACALVLGLAWAVTSDTRSKEVRVVSDGSGDGVAPLPMQTGLLSQERALLDETLKLSATEPDRAHARLIDLAKDSPARTTPEFAAIESAWAKSLLQKADAESSASIKTSLLESIESAPGVSLELRNEASTRLKALLSAESKVDPRVRKWLKAGTRDSMLLIKEALQPKVRRGLATRDESEALHRACQFLKDHECLDLLSREP